MTDFRRFVFVAILAVLCTRWSQCSAKKCYNGCNCTNKLIDCAGLNMTVFSLEFWNPQTQNYIVLDLGKNCNVTLDAQTIWLTNLQKIKFDAICNDSDTCVTAEHDYLVPLVNTVAVINNNFCGQNPATSAMQQETTRSDATTAITATRSTTISTETKPLLKAANNVREPTLAPTANSSTSKTGMCANVYNNVICRMFRTFGYCERFADSCTKTCGTWNVYKDQVCDHLYKHGQCTAAKGKCNRSCIPHCDAATVDICFNRYSDEACTALFESDGCHKAKGMCDKTCIFECRPIKIAPVTIAIDTSPDNTTATGKCKNQYNDQTCHIIYASGQCNVAAGVCNEFCDPECNRQIKAPTKIQRMFNPVN